MAELNYFKTLQELNKLKSILEGGAGKLNISQLEKDFLSFSKYNKNTELVVELPKLYPVEGQERYHLAAVLSQLGVGCEVPNGIDISGASEEMPQEDTVILLSLGQLRASHCKNSRSCLNPLIEKIYQEGGRLINDFAIHEALFGKVTAKRSELDLRELPIFPERFTTGPYNLCVKLNTPNRTVTRFIELSMFLSELGKQPKQSALDSKGLFAATEEAISLRQSIGSLSRYEAPESNTVVAETNSWVIRDDKTILFYLYSPQQKKNILVHFGESPFKTERPDNLFILNGEEHHQTLAKLVELGIFEPSMAVLQQRIKGLDLMYEGAARNGEQFNSKHYSEFYELMEKLKSIEVYFQDVKNMKRRKEFILKTNQELLEFLVYPNSEDSVVHEILPCLSWNKVVRTYHNTPLFKSQFEEVNEEGKKKMLEGIVSNLLLSNMQNNDVNVWLYKKYREICSSCGIKFRV